MGATGPGPATRERDAPGACLAWLGYSTACGPTHGAGSRRTPLSQGRHAAPPRAQPAAPPDHAAPLPPLTGTRRRPPVRTSEPAQARGTPPGPRRLGARATTTAPHPCRDPRRTPQRPWNRPPGSTGRSTTAAWSRACRWAWDGLALQRCSSKGHGCGSLGRSAMVGFFLGPRQTATLRAAAQRQVSAAAGSGSDVGADAVSGRLHTLDTH